MSGSEAGAFVPRGGIAAGAARVSMKFGWKVMGMVARTVMIPSSDGCQVPLELYVPAPCAAVDPLVRRPAVIICPGGGYEHLSEREAEPVALRFLGGGFNAFVLKYRVAPWRYPAQLCDLASAVSYVRAHADGLWTDRDRIAVLGFSAGGHLAGSLGVAWHREATFRPLPCAPRTCAQTRWRFCYAVVPPDVTQPKHLRMPDGSRDHRLHPGFP
jgi:acetyl esterase/lipase